MDFSLVIYRFVRRGWESFLFAAVRRIDCRAIFGFLINMRRGAFPYWMRLGFGAFLRRSQIVFLWALKNAFRQF